MSDAHTKDNAGDSAKANLGKVAAIAGAAAIGGAAGLAAGVLFAPKSGKETRKDIATKANEIKDTVVDKAGDLKAGLQDKATDLKTDIQSEVRSRIDQAGETIDKAAAKAKSAISQAQDKV